MGELPFNKNLIDLVRENRMDWLTPIFRFFTFIGSEMGYILIILGFYWLYNKNFALRLTLVVIVTSALNQLLKVLIKNPRPYVTDATYRDNWAISESDIEETAMQYSTPSGHAMGAMSFWSFIHHKIRTRQTKILGLIMIVFIGLSRPYLGVHYFEDVFLGWGLGLLVIYLIIKYESQLVKKWETVSTKVGVGLTVLLSLLLFFIAGFSSDFGADGEIYATLSGMISGLIVGYHLEGSKVGFVAEIKSLSNGTAKYLIGVTLSLGVLIGLDVLFAIIAEDFSLLGYILRFIRYATLGVVATLVSGKIFVELGLAESTLK